MHGMNKSNQKLYEAGRKRRAHFLKQHNGGKSIGELAKKAKVTPQRMSWMLIKAKGEN